MNKRPNTFARALAAALLCGAVRSVALAADVRPLEGPVILVRSGAVDEYMWYASTYVSSLVDDRLLGDAGMHALQATAVAGLVEKARSSHAKTLSLSVVYKASSSSDIYGVPTAAGQTKLCVITVPRSDAMESGETWARSIADGNVPPQVKVMTTGALPPPQ